MADLQPSVAAAQAQVREVAAELPRLLAAGAGGFALAARRTALVDAVVRDLYVATVPEAWRSEVAVLATGGYGRRHLAPHSDIDLLLLQGRAPGGEPILAKLERALWDSGLKPACICLRPGDLETQFRHHETVTSCIDVRELGGSPELHAAFHANFAELVAREGVGLAGRMLRDLQMDCTAALRELNQLEPNLKQAPFLLRDACRIFWISSLLATPGQARGFGQTPFLKPAVLESLLAAVDFLLRARVGLHLLAGRAEDVLVAQYQPELARRLGFAEQGHLRAEELFLRELYLRTRHVYLASREIVELGEKDPRLEPLSRKRLLRLALSAGYVRIGEHLHMTESPARQWGAVPSCRQLLEPFTMLLQAPLEIPCSLMNDLRLGVEHMAPGEDAGPDGAAMFRGILAAHQPVGHILTQMHFCGLLGRLLPEFEALTCAAQFDLLHQYTIDAHSLLVVSEFDSFCGGHGDRDTEPFHIVFDSLVRFDLLRLAALLHDCGKALPGEHAETGAPVAAAAALRLGFSAADAAEVEFLVRQHLLLAGACQHRDIDDATLVESLAGVIGTRARLGMLLLLTYADMRCVRSGTWTGWKAEQLWTLYRRLAAHLEETDAGQTDFWQELALYQPDADAPVPRPILEAHVERMAWPEYTRQVSFRRLLQHAEFALRHRPGQVQVVVTQAAHATRLMVVADDSRGFFPRLAGTLTGSGLRIVQGWCFTRRDGIVIDEVDVLDAASGEPIAEAAVPKIVDALQRVLTGQARAEDILARRRRTFPEPTEHPMVTCSVRVDQRSSSYYSIVDVRAGDRVGLLYSLGRVLERHGLDIRFVKISTSGPQVADTFYVVTEQGEKLDEAAVRALAADLELVALQPAR